MRGMEGGLCVSYDGTYLSCIAGWGGVKSLPLPAECCTHVNKVYRQWLNQHASWTNPDQNTPSENVEEKVAAERTAGGASTHCLRRRMPSRQASVTGTPARICSTTRKERHTRMI